MKKQFIGKRSGQRGVAAVELALGLPILILIVGSVVSVGRIAHIKIKLDGMHTVALRTCALDRAVTTDAQAEACLTNALTTVRLDECVDMEMTVTFDDVSIPFIDDEGLQSQTILSTLVSETTCSIKTLGQGNLVPDMTLTARARASRN